MRLNMAPSPIIPAAAGSARQWGKPTALGGQDAHQRRGAADRGEYCEAAGAIEQVTGERSVVGRANPLFGEVRRCENGAIDGHAKN
jgi:hypothetical protein